MTENYHDTLPCFQVGELYTGEPCAPYTITRVRHGVQQVQEYIECRQLPLLDVRRQALTDHFRYMRLQSKETLTVASRADLEGLVGETASHLSESELRHHVEDQLAVRHFAVWHDHSTVCGCGFILVTCKEVYNNLVHYTNDEHKNLTGQTVDIQAEVERPYIHLLAAGSSTASDHIAFTADRMECVKVNSTASTRWYTPQGQTALLQW